jgi:uncharacterized protein YkwD
MRGATIFAAVLLAACGNGRQPVSRNSAPPATSHVDDRDKRIIAELNELRSNPVAYAEKIDARRGYFQGKVLRLPGQVSLRTKEGVAALEEAVRALRELKPLPTVQPSPELAAAARDHVRNIGPKGLLAHKGTDGSSPSARAARYAKGFSSIGEVISFGPEGPAAVVIDLIVDDGVRDRGHRKILLDPGLRFAGVACGPHTVYRTMCVIDLADHLTEHR